MSDGVEPDYVKIAEDDNFYHINGQRPLPFHPLTQTISPRGDVSIPIPPDESAHISICPTCNTNLKFRDLDQTFETSNYKLNHIAFLNKVNQNLKHPNCKHVLQFQKPTIMNKLKDKIQTLLGIKAFQIRKDNKKRDAYIREEYKKISDPETGFFYFLEKYGTPDNREIAFINRIDVGTGIYEEEEGMA